MDCTLEATTTTNQQAVAGRSPSLGIFNVDFVSTMSEWTDYNYGGGQGGHGGHGGFYDSSYDFSGGAAGGAAPPQTAFMTPAPVPQPGDQSFGGAPPPGQEDFENEPPLLEELGINMEHILQKTLAVLNPFRATRPDVAGDSDLAGPLAFCLAFGSLLLLVGKVHFNYIYGIGVFGCVAMYGLLSMMSLAPVPFAVIVSVLGYCILPIVMLSAFSVVISLQGVLGLVLSGAAVVWCALSASKLFVTAFNMEHQQLLVAYPCSLLYAVFALITMF